MASINDMKDRAMHVEGSTKPEDDVAAGTIASSTTVIERRITRKTDWRLVPILAALYTISLIDRTNLGGARISGIDQDIGLDIGNRYSVVVLVFYVSYVFFELPSNILLKKFGAANWLGFLGLAFGLVTIGIGLSKNYATLVVLRVMLGAMEAGIFPGCIYLISSWYRRYEVSKRIAFFFTISSFLSAFANIMAYGFTQISSQPERHGWKWIFIVQGSITCAIAILTKLIVIDFPESKRNKFLAPEEKDILISRLVQERGEAEGGKITPAVLKEVAKKWHAWALAFIYMGGSTGLYGILFFLPLILRKGLGYSQVASFCLTAPPAAFGLLCSLAISWASDEYRVRGPFVILSCSLGIVGFAMTGFLTAPTPRYVGAFLGQAGTTSLIPISLAWGQNNIQGDAQKSVMSVIQVFNAGVGGIYSALVFRQQDAPAYIPGLAASGALLLAGALLTVVCSFIFWRANKKADRGELVIDGNAEFRYTW